MKKTIFFVFVFPLFCSLQAQVQVKPFPEEGFEMRIRNYINNMHIVDTHEHLVSPNGIKKSSMLDFTLLLHHYADDDIKSAGMAKADFEELLSGSLTVMEKWQAVKPFWEASFNTAYNRAVELTIDQLFGIKTLNESTVEELSARIREAYNTDWFYTVLKQKSKIDYVVVDSNNHSFGDTGMISYVKRFDYINIDSEIKIRNIENRLKTKINSLDEMEASLKKEFQAAVNEGNVAVKIGVAYSRTLFFEEVEKETAEAVFQNLRNSEETDVYSFEEVKPLQDYMTYRLIELAGEAGLPIQIHTGLQAGDGNLIENSNPTHLANLFLKYRDVNFILFHGGYPFGSELATLAKNFRNVAIDMCWLYIISPSYAERYLHEWLETIPANKIMAFGGDFHNVEGVYGHQLFARQVVANVLTEKVRDGYFTETEALRIAQMILYDNAVSILKLSN
ncbi:amidohydrolase family protein [Maribellus maritimus]|uniref:amidohydrolase family protein n=1 Tax=Maribellus maritimus TaxID=2870838 RepID=UPI001EEA0080|nr:amidohydrolase family protein [Maribellus maritimus]MCG6186338.1 amidohydrolase family protein [Maribellus maritimus]